MISPALSTPSQLEQTAEALRAWIEEREMRMSDDDERLLRSAVEDVVSSALALRGKGPEDVIAGLDHLWGVVRRTRQFAAEIEVRTREEALKNVR